MTLFVRDKLIIVTWNLSPHECKPRGVNMNELLLAVNTSVSTDHLNKLLGEN